MAVGAWAAAVRPRSAGYHRRVVALLPAALAALFAFWAGTFSTGATGSAAAVGGLALLAFATAGGAREWRDPLRLGRGAALLPWALWLTLAASAWASPVGRAGRVALWLFPAYLLVAAASGRWLSGRAAAERGALALSAVVSGVAGWGLVDRFFFSAERAAMPLGHHNLQAALLVALLPATLVPLARRGPQRLAGGAAALVGAAGIVATGSLAGQLTLALALAAGSRRARRAWRVLLGLALLALAFAVPRLERLVRGEDPSAAGRLGYLAAGWQGWQQRPLLGWGPGATPWTAAEHLAPAPGVREAGELVGELHNLPVQLGYELGWTGALVVLALAIAFVRVRWAERCAGADRTLMKAGLIGLGGLAAMSLGSAAIAVTALPVAAAVMAGLALAARDGATAAGGARAAAGPAAGATEARGEGGRDAPSGLLAAPGDGDGGSAGRSGSANPRAAILHLRAWPVWLWALAALVGLLPLWRAGRAYDLARIAPDAATASRHLERAVTLDPEHPLYRARLAWLGGRDPAVDAEEALRAARGAPGAAPLWLAAGVLARESGALWAPAALTRACALDPLGAMAPFQQLMAAPGHPFAPALGARALLAEPRLAAASLFADRPRLYGGVLAHLEHWDGIDQGWRAEMASRGRSLWAAPAGSRRQLLGLTETMDEEPARSASLHLFRRAPWPADLGIVELRGDLLARLDLPPAAALPTSAAFAFGPTLCGP